MAIDTKVEGAEYRGSKVKLFDNNEVRASLAAVLMLDKWDADSAVRLIAYYFTDERLNVVNSHANEGLARYLDQQTAELEALWAKVEPFLQHTQLCGKTFWGRGAGICNCGLDALLAARRTPPLARCAANRDGDCDHPDCPQLKNYQKACPLIVEDEEL